MFDSTLKLQIQQLMTLVSDLRDELATERNKFREERKELIDKIMALSNPPALRMMQDPRGVPERRPFVAMRPHIPGSWPPPPKLNEVEVAAAEALLDKVTKPNGSE